MKNKTLVIIIGIIALVGIAMLWGTANTTPSNSPAQALRADKNEAKAPSVGTPFPKFSLIDIDGNEATNSSLSGKPSILWFTTSWCVPCQIGAKEVAKLDDELGGDAFNVLVVFVDPRESADDLQRWKQSFGNKDWIVAFDNQSNPLAQKINLKFLDTKYLLDDSGIIRDVNLQIANQRYLDIVRSVIQNP